MPIRHDRGKNDVLVLKIQQDDWITHSIYLVGGIPTLLKNMSSSVSWDDYSIPNMMGKS